MGPVFECRMKQADGVTPLHEVNFSFVEFRLDPSILVDFDRFPVVDFGFFNSATGGL
jgi:hypothetical protein